MCSNHLSYPAGRRPFGWQLALPPVEDGAPCGNRTHYLFLTKEVLYQ